MTIPQLENFLIVAETLNYRKAAEKIYIAQPALSRQVQQLEEEIGVVLFDRSKKQIALTAAGVSFRDDIEKMIGQLERAINRASLIQKGSAGEIRIGHASSAMNSVIPGLLRFLKVHCPLLKANLIEGPNNLIFNKMSCDEVDFGYVANALISAELSYQEIYKENYVLILPENHNINKDNFRDLSQLHDENWILHPWIPGSGYMDEISRIFRKYNLYPKIVHESPNTSTVLRLVEAGLGIAMMGKSTLIGYNLKIKSIALENMEDQLVMKLVWKKEREKELGPYLEVLREYKYL